MINKVILIGNVGADPEVRTLENGTKVARVRIATTERIYNRQTQEAREHTEWHTITLWRGLAETADRFVRKGSQIYIEGKLRSNEWTDSNGVKRYGIEVLADDMKLLGRKGDNPVAPIAGQPATSSYQTPDAQPQPAVTPPTPQTNNTVPPIEDEIDDLPF